MIDTIFYFIDHLPLEEYISKVNNGDIADHTIVFVDDTKSIYKGGKLFGSTSDPTMTEKIITLIRENEYSLPIASGETLGGIKVGDYLNINRNGELSVSVLDLPLYDDSTLSSRLDGVEYMIGNIDETTVTPLLSQGVRIATIRVGSLISNIYAPAPTALPEAGSADDPYSYDDSALRDWLSDLQNLVNTTKQDLLNRIAELLHSVELARTDVNNLSTRLTNVINNLDATITDRVALLMSDALWILEHFAEGAISTNPGNNFGLQDVEAYLQLIGVWSRNNDITRTDWTNIIQTVHGIELSVSSLILHDGNGDAIPSEALLAWINAAVDGAVATIENGTAYARVSDIDGIIEWLYSGLKLSTDPELTYSQLVSAANNHQLGTSAIAGLTTRVETIEGSYVAESTLSAKVDTAIGTILTNASLDSALVAALASINNDIAGLRTQITNSGGQTLSTVDILNSVYNEITSNTLQSGIQSAIDTRSETVALNIVNAITDANNNVTAASVISSIINDNTAKASLSSYVQSVTTTNSLGLTVDEIVESYVNAVFLAALGNVEFSAFVTEVRNNTSAISALTTRVAAIDGSGSGYITTANLGSSILNINKGTGVWAGLVTEGKLSNDIATASASLTSSYTNAINTAIAGVYTKAEVDTATAALQASINGKVNNSTASIILAINGTGSSAKISADKIDITGAAVFNAINNDTSNTTINGSKITTGTISADKLTTNAIDAITGNFLQLITDTLTGGTATFNGAVNATSFVAGSSSGFNVTTSENSISFNTGNESRAYFTSEDNGMQLYIKNTITGEWCKLDFSNLQSGTSYPANSMVIYKLRTASGSQSLVEDYRIIYYQSALLNNKYGVCFTDEYGTTTATNSNMGSGWYIYDNYATSPTYKMIRKNSQMNRYECNVPNSTTRNFCVYRPISFDNMGIITKDMSSEVIGYDITSVSIGSGASGKTAYIPSWYITDTNNSYVTVSADNIYMYRAGNENDYISLTSSVWANSTGYTYSLSNNYQFYEVVMTKQLGNITHWSSGEFVRNSNTNIYSFAITDYVVQ